MRLKGYNNKMAQTNQEIPYFLLITEKYLLGTPRIIDVSDRAIDIPFHDLAHNYDLQRKLKLSSALCVRPELPSPLTRDLSRSEVIEYVAHFIAAFSDDPQEIKQRTDYLINNGLVRILVKDDALLTEVKKVA